jgi:hypothetical protein
MIPGQNGCPQVVGLLRMSLLPTWPCWQTSPPPPEPSRLVASGIGQALASSVNTLFPTGCMPVYRAGS